MNEIVKTLYDKTTGELLYPVRGLKGHVLFPETESYVDGEHDPKTHKVVNGEVVEKSQAEQDAALNEIAMRELRAKRNAKLASTDWTQLPDSGRNRKAWAQYRQALRDLPANTADPRNPVWPTPPEN